MESVGDRLPVTGQLHDVSCVQDPVPEEMVELKSGAVDGPVVLVVRVVQVVPLRRQDRQVLHVAPCQLRPARACEVSGEISARGRNSALSEFIAGNI